MTHSELTSILYTQNRRYCEIDWCLAFSSNSFSLFCNIRHHTQKAYAASTSPSIFLLATHTHTLIHARIWLMEMAQNVSLIFTHELKYEANMYVNCVVIFISVVYVVREQRTTYLFRSFIITTWMESDAVQFWLSYGARCTGSSRRRCHRSLNEFFSHRSG